MRLPARLGSTAALLFCVGCVFAAPASPVGTWTSFDDKTGQAKAVIRLSEHNGELEGSIIKVLQSDQGPNPICKECEGERHNQPVTGMRIVWGLKQHGDDWEGGHILDPHNGKIYRCKMQPSADGSKLEVRGYIGFALLGRTQIWQREAGTTP
ncbi:MAG TPA: DUF2147 domain-containing protein [Rhodanobacteraceae bacterium]|nr:DUF2147 domain-containing protein [Rhodanobacteraceae bacterium]